MEDKYFVFVKSLSGGGKLFKRFNSLKEAEILENEEAQPCYDLKKVSNPGAIYCFKLKDTGGISYNPQLIPIGFCKQHTLIEEWQAKERTLNDIERAKHKLKSIRNIDLFEDNHLKPLRSLYRNMNPQERAIFLLRITNYIAK